MGKPTGFLDYEREDARAESPKERIKHFNEFHIPLSREEQQKQGARCMECGVPFCQNGAMLAGMASGCPLHNLVPETNDLVYSGNWKQAYERLTKTHSFPEFTSRVCPALCEAACTCNLNGKPVSTKENERAIIEHAYEMGWVQPQTPKIRTGKKVAVVGSGPSGLAAAQQLNRRGHSVTVFERHDRIGGLLRYGIPNMKLDKAVNKLLDEDVRIIKEYFANGDYDAADAKTRDLCTTFRNVIEYGVEQNLLSGVVSRFSRNVSTLKIPCLNAIAQADISLFDSMMTKYSYYDHSHSIETPQPPPEIEDIEADLIRMRDWAKSFAKRSDAEQKKAKGK